MPSRQVRNTQPCNSRKLLDIILFINDETNHQIGRLSAQRRNPGISHSVRWAKVHSRNNSKHDLSQAAYFGRGAEQSVGKYPNGTAQRPCPNQPRGTARQLHVERRLEPYTSGSSWWADPNDDRGPKQQRHGRGMAIQQSQVDASRTQQLEKGGRPQ